MTHDGSRSRGDVLGAMDAQYEIQRREIMEDNDRMKAEQAKVEAYMMERQNALNDLLNQRKEVPNWFMGEAQDFQNPNLDPDYTLEEAVITQDPDFDPIASHKATLR